MRILVLLGMLATSYSAFSQTCSVTMVDQRNQSVRTFTAFGEPGRCIEALKECRKAIRLSPELGGVDCVEFHAPIPAPYNVGEWVRDTNNNVGQITSIDTYYSVARVYFEFFNGQKYWEKPFHTIEILPRTRCLDSREGRTCLGNKVVNINSDKGIIEEIFTNGMAIVRFNGFRERYIHYIEDLGIQKDCTYSRICLGSRVQDRNSNVGVVKEVYSNGLLYVDFYGYSGLWAKREHEITLIH